MDGTAYSAGTVSYVGKMFMKSTAGVSGQAADGEAEAKAGNISVSHPKRRNQGLV
jgi:hypothetical protein